MEMAPMNAYTAGASIPNTGPPKTEDIYQTLHSPAAGGPREAGPQLRAGPRKLMFMMLLLVSAVLLVIILVIVGVYTSTAFTNGALHQDEEVWHLHQNVFFLFWHGEGDCPSAVRFCHQRNATLATLQLHNKIWALTRAQGKQLWILDGFTEGLGGITEGSAGRLMENVDYWDSLDDYYPWYLGTESPGDGIPEHSACVLLGPALPYNNHVHGRSQGWVCQRAACSLGNQ